MADLIGTQFLAGPQGIDLGVIEADAAAAIRGAVAPIRLQHGYEGPKGFGNRHVESHTPRMKLIQGLGFKTFLDFSCVVAKNYERLGAGDDGRVLAIHRYQGYDLRLVLQFCPGQQPYWSIVTGIPARVVRCPILFEKSRVSGREPTPSIAVKRSRFETLSLPRKSNVGDNGS